jgi:hypothetical protein
MSRIQNRIKMYQYLRPLMEATQRPKLLPAIINQLFADGLPHGWGK